MSGEAEEVVTEPNTDGGGEDPMAGMDPEMAANPQPTYKALREAMPVMPVEGLGVVLTRKIDIDDAFKHPEIFSSNADAVDLSNVRPMIPLQIDPPDHKKYRKILDPIFAPKQMALLDEPVTQLVNDLIDRFIDEGEVDFAAQFSVPFPSQVFLTLHGPPARGAASVPQDEGRHHPSRPRHGMPPRQRRGEVVPGRDRDLDLRLLQRDPRRPRTEARERHPLDRSSTPRSTATSSRARTSSTSASCSSSPGSTRSRRRSTACSRYLAQNPEQRQRIVDDPSIIPAAVEEMLRWETPVIGVVRIAIDDTEVARVPDREGPDGHGAARLRQHRRGRVRRRRHRRLRPRGQPAPGLRRRRAPLPRITPRRARSCASPCASGIAASPSTPCATATRSSTRARSVPSSTSRWSSSPPDRSDLITPVL